jgi:hypothetical protein
MQLQNISSESLIFFFSKFEKFKNIENIEILNTTESFMHQVSFRFSGLVRKLI